MPCIFPFIYHGAMYTACTTVENNGIAWCSTNVDISGTHVEDNWGNCSPGCSLGNDVQMHIIYTYIYDNMYFHNMHLIEIDHTFL